MTENVVSMFIYGLV